MEDGNADLSPFLGKHLQFGDWRQRRKNLMARQKKKIINFLAGRRRPAIPQNGPKTARFGPFRAVRGRKILPSIDIFIPTVFPASCCGALRSKTPIKNGYFWAFLGISGIFLKKPINWY